MELLQPEFGFFAQIILLGNLVLLILSCGWIVFKKDMNAGQKIVLLLVSFLLPVIGSIFALISLSITKSGKA
jgi:hypothetical protein